MGEGPVMKRLLQAIPFCMLCESQAGRKKLLLQLAMPAQMEDMHQIIEALEPF